MGLFARIDGCKAGWIYVAIDRRGRFSFGIRQRFADAMQTLAGAELILMDLPIGLPSANRPSRHCDTAARKAIAPRGSAVFPRRRALLFRGRATMRLARLTRELGKKLSLQSWAIAPKIREGDYFLKARPPAGRIREMHPEVAFWALKGEHPLSEKKKKRAGERERVEILLRHYPPAQTCYEACQREFPRHAVARNDILDALVCAVTASHNPDLSRSRPTRCSTRRVCRCNSFTPPHRSTRDSPEMRTVQLKWRLPY